VGYLKLALGILKIANMIMDYAERQKYINEGENRAINRASELQIKRIEKAIAARENAHLDDLPDTADELPDDGFKRD
jgi:hypothetical protein